MTSLGRIHGRFTRPVAAVLLGIAAVSLVLWRLALSRSVSDPIADIPFVVALTCLLGACSLYATSVAGRSLERRSHKHGESTVSRPATVPKAGIASLTLFVLGSFLLIATAIPYFALDRGWPISPSQAGSVQQYLLLGMVLVPILVGALTAGTLAFESRRE
ncbi:hypothetical protein ACLI4Y_13905 [Natrialbaceae archaeon A-CW3]